MSESLPFGCYYGSKIQDKRVVGLTLSECQYSPGERLPRHAHQHAYLSLVLDGSYTETCDGSRTHDCVASQLILHPESERHENRFLGKGGRVFNLELDSAWSERVSAHTAVLNERREYQSGAPPVHLMARLYEEFRLSDAASPLAIEGLTLELLALLGRRAAEESDLRPPRWLQEARELLHREYLHHPTLAGVAAEVGVHPTHLARAFRAHYHCTVGEYVRQRRIDFACTQMGNDTLSLGEIALTAGFADQSHFTRIFKRRMGLSPGAYRDAARRSSR